MRLTAAITFVITMLINLQYAGAHESRPLYVEIVERAPKTFVVTWKIPPSALAVTSPRLVMPKSCTASAPPAGTRLIKRQLFQCQSDLSGENIQVVFPGYNPSISTLFRFERLSGEKHTAIQSPKEQPVWQVPDKEVTISVAQQYLALGIEHILKGYDHLLFVACLLFIAGSWRRVLVVITGFTVAHSITLALSALNLVRISIPPVEATIALSIVFLATEIARDRRETLTWRYPIAVAGSFGLLHGFGFASVLSEVGLPQTEVPTALLFFNVGVEVGQILFVGALLGAAAVLSLLGVVETSTAGQHNGLGIGRYAKPMAYVVGSLAAYWTIERIAGFVA